MNFPFGTNGKFIILRCPNTLSTLGYALAYSLFCQSDTISIRNFLYASRNDNHIWKQQFNLPNGPSILATQSPTLRRNSSPLHSPSFPSSSIFSAFSPFSSFPSSSEHPGAFRLCQRFMNFCIHRRKWGGGTKG